MHDWLDRNLTENQWKKPHSDRTSIFAAYMKHAYGGKYFLMALLQEGISWAPDVHQVHEDPAGASEDVAHKFIGWLERVMVAIAEHKEHPQTKDARRRSGGSKGQHGLTPEEEANRTARALARKHYFGAKELWRQLQANS